MLDRRSFLSAGVAATVAASAATKRPKAQIAITLDLEMSRHYPRRGIMEWDFQKGNLDPATKKYSVDAGRVAKQLAGKIHYFCVGRVLEQSNIKWLKGLAAEGHPIGNHTYDHVYVKAATPAATQFRFRRAPWLVKGKTASQIVEENIRLTNTAMKARAGITANGFRTPGGFYTGLHDAPHVQKMLQNIGFKWVSSVYPRHSSGKPKQEPSESVYQNIVEAARRTQPFAYKSGLIEVPMSPISDVTAFRSHYWKLPYFLKAIGRVVTDTIERGGVFDFIAHPSCLVVEDPKFETIKLICKLVNQSKGRAEIVGLDQIAKTISQ